MRSYDEMAQNVFRRGDEYFQKKQKQAAFIKKGVSFMSITGIIIALGLVAGSTQLLSPSIPDEPQQIDLNTGITTEVVTSTAETAEASVTSTSASVTAAASAEVADTHVTVTESMTTSAADSMQTAIGTVLTATQTTTKTTLTSADTSDDEEFSDSDHIETVPFIITAPDNAEIFEYGYLHTEYYSFAEGTFKSIGEDVSYRDKEYVNRVYIPYEWEAQHVYIKLDGCSSDVSEAVTAIVEKYSDELSGLETSEREGVYFLIEDVIDEKTSDMPETVEDKSKAVMDMCREITAAGGKITEAVYSPYVIGYGWVKFNGIYVYGFPGTEEEFNAYVADISDSLNISPEDAIPEDMVGSVLPDSNHFCVTFKNDSNTGYTTNADTVAEVYKLWEAILADHPECAIRYYECIFEESADSGSETSVNYGEIDILAGIQEETETSDITGDADGNGKVDLSDAVQVLTIYAKNAAGLNSAIYGSALDSSADVNSDGNIDLDDAVAILTYYARNAAGLAPTWDEIINA